MKSEYINCKNCKDDCRCRGKNITPICVSFTPVKTTNADRIRAMTDEELAEWMATIEKKCYARCGVKSNFKRFNNQWLDWLKAPVDKEGG